MPLGFPCLSHGTVAFGFFNIETDLLLLEHYFFFADFFCSRVVWLSRKGEMETVEEEWPVQAIEKRSDIGDLMGAIHSIRYEGFIGEVYRHFPFPETQAGFKQSPEGYRNRSVVEGIMRKYAGDIRIPFETDQRSGTVRIGEYLFSGSAFRDLVQYVWLGGYPRWRDETRPGYAIEMKRAVEESRFWLFSGTAAT